MTTHMDADEDGLIGKYLIFKRDNLNLWVEKSTPSFVLSPAKDDDYGSASRAAMRAYAAAIELRNQELADDLRRWVKRIESMQELERIERGG